MTRLLVIDHNAARASDRGLYAALHREGIAQTTVIAPMSWIEMGMVTKFEQSTDGCRATSLRVLFRGKHQRVLYRHLSHVVRNCEPDIVLCNAEPENLLAFQVTRIQRPLRRKFKLVLVSWRNIDYQSEGYPYKLAFVHRMIERSALPSVDSIIAHTSASKEIYRMHGFDRVTEIPPAVDCSLFTPTDSPRPEAGSPFMIGYAGRLTDLKGGDLLLRALSKLPPHCSLTMIGAGERERTWRNAANELHIADRVHWHGPVPHSSMPNALRSLDVLVLPSRTGKRWKEQFGRILIEAMACGVPVIGSSSGEIPLVIDGCGEVFPEGDEHALAETIRSLQSDAERRRELTRRGLERVRSTFSFEAVMPLYRLLFEQLTGKQS